MPISYDTAFGGFDQNHQNPKKHKAFMENPSGIGFHSYLKSEFINKSSLSITLPNHKGSLSQVLSVIAFYDVDLSKIESVPVIGEPWHYRFYIDVLFDNYDKYKNMLQAIGPLTDKLGILGEYTSGSKSFEEIHSKSKPASA